MNPNLALPNCKYSTDQILELKIERNMAQKPHYPGPELNSAKLSILDGTHRPNHLHTTLPVQLVSYNTTIVLLHCYTMVKA